MTDRVRASKSFYNVAKGMSSGAELLPRIRKVEGRGGATISTTTIRRWGQDGIVKVTYRDPKRTEHFRMKPIASVTLTPKGKRLIDNAAAWRDKAK